MIYYSFLLNWKIIFILNKFHVSNVLNHFCPNLNIMKIIVEWSKTKAISDQKMMTISDT